MMIDDQDNPTPRCRKALNSVARCRAEMAAVYRQARSGTLPLGDATRLVFMLTSIARTLADEGFEQRLKALEQLPDATPARLPQLEDAT